ncbi:MAG TPA: amidase [Candidatus Limnocylindrales bacterium]|nr:amidase [Candidatus Limnocylindrales bacterium]
MNQEDLCFMPATDLVAAFLAKKLSPVEVMDAVIARIERINPIVNAFCTLTLEEARQKAKEAEVAIMRGDRLGPLHGVPVSIKDLVITKGVRTMRGSKIYENYIPDEDAPVVERLRDAGAIMLGKTTTPEFGWKGVTDSPVTGITRNPWNLERTCGGSSGGAGVAVAAGLGPIAQGSDGGGSIRIPSSFCGIYGLKPTYGRIAAYPPSAMETFSHLGPMTRTVKDAALMMQVMAGPDERDRLSLPAQNIDYLAATEGDIRGLRVAWSVDLGYAAVDPEVARITEAAAKVFIDLGCQVEAVDPGFGNPEPFFAIFWIGGIGTFISDYLPKWESQMDPGLLTFAEQLKSLTAKDYVQATFKRVEFWQKVRKFFEKYDLLLTPSVAVPPFQIGINSPPEIAGEKISWINWTPFTYPFNLTGQPAATVPCGWTQDGLPVGLQIVGRRYDEATVLRASAAFERAKPWANKRPKL